MERRSQDNDEPSRQPSNPNIFDDDYEIDPDEEDFMPSTSDGFRPTNTSEVWRHDRQNHDRNEPPQRQTSTTKPNDNDLRRMATRNSTAKVRDSMAQDRRPSLGRRSSAQLPPAHRDSVSSTGSFATTSNSENPFETGPSHPYGMYPQHTVARPSSIATTSTERQPHRSMSLQRPTHPYAMYSQSGLVDEEPAEEPVPPSVPQIQTAIPVGFPGLNNGYHRVLGPDGEEQDIIGPDGHTEQLPPYSRFPEEGPTKASLAAEASASRVLPAPIQVADPDDPFTTPVSPASPLSVHSFSAPPLPTAPLLPSVTPARLPPQRPETQTGNVAPITSTQSNTVPAEPSDSSSASLLTRESSFSEKAEPNETKPSWRKRKLWGKIPMGVAVFILVMMLVFAVSLGAAIGTVVAKKHSSKDKDRNKAHEQPQSQVTGPNGSLFDAIPISTPPGLAPLPTGAFSLPLGIPQESNPGCLTQANQYSAWSCKMTFAPLVITINNTSNSDGSKQFASMKGGPAIPDGAILYGLQTPQLDFKEMQLVLDLDYKAYGPAYHFSARYDKLVILRPEEISLTTGSSAPAKRQDDKGFRQRFQVQPGDYPWYCFWNSTYIEGYIYSEDNSTAASFTAFPTQATLSTPSPTSVDSAAFGVATAAAATSAGGVTSPTQPAQVTATPSPVARRDVPTDPSSPSRMAPYPRIVKIEERRLPDSPQPYCQQMVLLDNGNITPAPNGKDSPVRIWLQESDPSYEEYFSAQATQTSSSTKKSKRELTLEKQRRSDPGDACHCQWMFK
ncbi:Nn.00g086800.m01.CDS01 [Neocucurbitaria sp. VM-36]